MLRHSYRIALCLAFFCLAPASQAEEPKQPIPVVATFSILGDWVNIIGGERVNLTTLVGPNADTHAYQPTPKASKALAQAKLLFTNGLEFETWLNRLVDASQYQGKIVVTTEGITPIAHGKKKHEEHSKGYKENNEDNEDHHDHEKHDEDHHEHDHDKDKKAKKHADEHHDHDGHEKHADKHDEHDDHEEHGHHDHHHHGENDPHAWQSLTLAKTYVENIAQALQTEDPDGEAFYEERKQAYLKQLEQLAQSAKERFASLPENQRTVITNHDAFTYFSNAYDLQFLSLQGLSSASKPTAKQMAELIKSIREQKANAIFAENLINPKLIEQIAKESGVTIGGTLYTGALSEKGQGAETYLQMMQHNIDAVYKALSQQAE